MDRDAVPALIGAVEELGDVAKLFPVGRGAKVIAVLGLEGRQFGRILEPVFAARPADRVGLGRDRPVLARVAGVCGGVFQRGRGRDLADLVGIEELGQVDMVPRLRRCLRRWLSPTNMSQASPLALNSVKALLWKSDHGVVSTVTVTQVSASYSVTSS